MRGLIEGARGDEVVLIDGVKVVDPGGWTLVVPDAEEPVTHVYAEADDAAAVAAARGAEAAVAEIEAVLAEG